MALEISQMNLVGLKSTVRHLTRKDLRSMQCQHAPGSQGPGALKDDYVRRAMPSSRCIYQILQLPFQI